MNTVTSSLQQRSQVVNTWTPKWTEGTPDPINLARSRGEYSPRWTRNVKGILAKQSPDAKQTERPHRSR